MRFLIVVAFFHLALTCLRRGIGAEPQTIFADGNAWLWFLPAFGWMVSGVVVALKYRDGGAA